MVDGLDHDPDAVDIDDPQVPQLARPLRKVPGVPRPVDRAALGLDAWLLPWIVGSSGTCSSTYVPDAHRA